MSSTGLCRLPELPDGIRILTNEESARLRLLYPTAPSSTKNCPTCRGERRFLWYRPEGGEGDATYECPCEDQLVMHRYFLWSGIGTAYQRLSRADCTAVEPGAMDAMDYWLQNGDAFMRSGTGLLMTGNRGAGKTLLSILMLKDMLARGYDGYFTTFSDLITMLLKGWRSDEEMRWYHAKIRNAALLVVDDVGREVKSRQRGADGQMRDFSHSSAEFALESVLRHRVAMGLPTIITANPTIEELTQHYGQHFKSLLTEAAKHYAFVGSDFRKVAGNRGLTEAVSGLVRPVVVG